MKKIILLPVLFLMLNFNSFSQNVIQGTVKNEKGNLIGGRRCAMIRLKQGNKIIHFTGSNYKGEYLISDISSGIYSIEAIDWESGSSVVYLNLIIDSGDINTINLEIKSLIWIIRYQIFATHLRYLIYIKLTIPLSFHVNI